MGLTDKNLFAYCDNNPVIRADSGGTFWHIVVGAAVGAVVSFTASVVGDIVAGNKINWANAGISAAFGAASGALAATGLGSAVQIVGGALLAGAENVVSQGRDNGFNNIDYAEVALSTIVGGVSSNTNGLSKATANHLNKQGVNATKRIVSEIKSDGIRVAGKVINSASKYYFSQTSTLFYKPLMKSAADSLIDSARGFLFSSTVMTVR